MERDLRDKDSRFFGHSKVISYEEKSFVNMHPEAKNGSRVDHRKPLWSKFNGTTTLNIMTFSLMTIIIMTLSRMTFSLMTLSIMTPSIMTFSIIINEM
jgi:hypothetical protein